MNEGAKSQSKLGRYYIVAILVVVVTTVFFLPRNDPISPSRMASPRHFKLEEGNTTAKVKSFGVNLAAATPSQPTINPTNPYSPMPLRVGTVGATTYHHPFCPYAKQSLTKHGLEKRINYWTREQVADSGRPGDKYCIAGVFDCSDVGPKEFAMAGNDPWCGANLRSSHYSIDGINAEIADKFLCKLDGRIGIFVDHPDDCINNGAVRHSGPSCDHAACSACTTDCDTACADCVKVTLSSLNMVTLGMGDANHDGETNEDDYLYYHECYSGPIAATIPCQNTFDFDADTDVDTADFDLFVQAYNTGNITWARNIHPTAAINPPKPELPLRVTTLGSKYYHRIDCPSVNSSWQTWGIDRRDDYFTWKQVEDGGKIPDTVVCLPGIRENPSGTWQKCTLDDDGDGILNCDDPCPGHDNPCCLEKCWTMQSFPLDLQGQTPESGNITLTLNAGWRLIAPEATAITLVMTIFDADQVHEGRLFVNGTRVATLFGNQLPGDGEVTFSTDISLYHDGANTLKFWHDSTAGYRVDNIVLNFN